MKIFTNPTQLIGNTPLLEASRLTTALGLTARLLLKIEAFNPGGSIKDRVALAMIEDAERKQLLPAGGTIIEATSGNTGIGLAWIANLKGYRLILTMPETMSIERQKLLKVLGAEVVLTPGAEGMNGAVKRAEQLKNEIPGSVIMQQFSNESCVTAHMLHTGREILDATDGQVDALIAGVGTGGTLTGIAKALKSNDENVRIIAVEPEASPVLSGGKSGGHNIQGIGAGFIPPIYVASLVDEIMQVTDSKAREGVDLLLRHEGLFCGISSGAALSAALRVAQRPEFARATLVVMLPDSGNRYLSLL